MALGTAGGYSGCDGTEPQRTFPRQPGTARGDGRATVLASDEPPGRTVAGIRGGAEPGTGLPLQNTPPCRGHDRPGVGGQLHGLGQAPAAQGGGQNPYATQTAKASAHFCCSRPRSPARKQTSAGT